MSGHDFVIGALANRIINGVVYSTGCKNREYNSKDMKDNLDVNDVRYW